MHTPVEHVAAVSPCSFPTTWVTKGKNTPPATDIPTTQAVVSFTRRNVVQNHAESADLRQTTKIVIAGGVRACVRAGATW